MGRFAVETLALPALKPETVCSYSIVIQPFVVESPATPEKTREIEQGHWVEAKLERNQGRAAEKSCAPKLAPLGFSSLKDVREKLNWFELTAYPAEHMPNIQAQSPWGCRCEDLSKGLKYALFDCDGGRVQITFFFWYRGFRVFRVADGARIMDLKLPHRPQFSGVLATKDGVTYVVLLRDGAELEGYCVRSSG
jgi:hypothetical protein